MENPNAQFDDDDNDISVYELFHTLGLLNNDQALAGATPLSRELDKKTQLNKKIARLEAKKRLLKKRQKLAILQDKKSREFPLNKDKSSNLYK